MESFPLNLLSCDPYNTTQNFFYLNKVAYSCVFQVPSVSYYREDLPGLDTPWHLEYLKAPRKRDLLTFFFMITLFHQITETI